MGARIRESWGTSWRDPHVPGTRHWRAHSVSFGFGTYLLGWLFWYGVLWPFFFIWLWLATELIVFTGSAILVTAGWLAYSGRPRRIVLLRLGVFWLLDLRF